VNLRRATRCALLAVGASWASIACGDRTFVRADPPATSGGVTVALAGQKCRRRVRHDQNGLLDLYLEVNVSNAGPAPVTIVPASLSLVLRGDASLPHDSDAPSTLPPGASSRVRVHYIAWSNARCNEPMSLSLAGALPAPPAPLGFVPEASDT
jgi:hypothetical protein